MTAYKSLEGKACSGQAHGNNELLEMKEELAVDNDMGCVVLVIGFAAAQIIAKLSVSV